MVTDALDLVGLLLLVAAAVVAVWVVAGAAAGLCVGGVGLLCASRLLVWRAGRS